MDGLALLCNLHADGPTSVRCLRATGVHTLADVQRLPEVTLTTILKASRSLVRRFVIEARQLEARLADMPLEPELRTAYVETDELPPKTSAVSEDSSLVNLAIESLVREANAPPSGFEVFDPIDPVELAEPPSDATDDFAPSPGRSSRVEDDVRDADDPRDLHGRLERRSVLQAFDLQPLVEGHDEPLPTQTDAGAVDEAICGEPVSREESPSLARVPVAADAFGPPLPPDYDASMVGSVAAALSPATPAPLPEEALEDVGERLIRKHEIPGLDGRTCERLVQQGVRTYRSLVDLANLKLSRRTGIVFTKLLDLRFHARTFLRRPLESDQREPVSGYVDAPPEPVAEPIVVLVPHVPSTPEPDLRDPSSSTASTSPETYSVPTLSGPIRRERVDDLREDPGVAGPFG